MGSLQSLVSFIVLLGVLIFVHELGHFLVAKALNVKVLRFSIGFGPRIFGFTRGETEYQVAWIPLGGYVKMAGDQPYDEISPEDAERGFLNQAPWKRGLIVAAGPAFNLVFPVLAYFLLYFFVGSRDVASTRVQDVEPGVAAAAIDLRPGDRVLEINDKKMRTFGDVIANLQDLAGRRFTVRVERDGAEQLLVSESELPADVAPSRRILGGLLLPTARPRPPIVAPVPQGLAERAGLQRGDRLISVDGALVKTEDEARDALARAQGDVVVRVLRDESTDVPGARVSWPTTRELVIAGAPKGAGYPGLGLESAELTISRVIPKSPAERAGVRAGDRLVSVDGVPIESWNIFALALRRTGEAPFTLTWRSGTELKTKEVKQAWVEIDDPLGHKSDALLFGIQPTSGQPVAFEPEFTTVRYGALEAIQMSLEVVPAAIISIGGAIGKLLTGELPFRNLGGPLTLYDIAAKSAESGLESYLQNMALLSINLGLMNLLPIPILDGFHLLAALWESIRRRPIPVRAREIANMVGLALLAVIMVRVFANDLSKYLPRFLP